ncbi:MAG: VanW family protein [Candidatus Nanopelagicales bacterium]
MSSGISSPPQAEGSLVDDGFVPDVSSADLATNIARQQRPLVTRKQRNIRIAVLCLFWATAMFATVYALGSNRVPDGVTVNGVAIGGLDRQSALNTLNAAVAARRDEPIKLTALDNTISVKPSDLGIDADVAATVDSAIANRWNPFDLPEMWRGGGEKPIILTLDQTKLNNQVDTIGARFDRPMAEPEITYVGTTPKLTEGTTGTLVNREAAAAAIAGGYLTADKSIELPVGSSSPTVSPEQAGEVETGAAVAAVAAPIAVTAGDVTAQASPADIAATLTFQAQDGQLRPVVDGAALRAQLGDQLKSVDTPAKDATWDVSSGTPVLKPSAAGSGVTDENLGDQVKAALDKTGDARAATLSLGPLQPKLTTEEAATLGITEPMAKFTQPFPYAAYRVQNIGRAAKKINNTLLRPGDTFSMNDIVGERTKANGFTTGYVVGEGGRLQEDLGGGVSTLATTLWTSAFFAGLERVEQGSHLIWISRYRPGLEATVAWGQLDLKFRNDTPNGVLITTKMTNDSVKVSIWGKKQYSKVKAISGPKQNVTPFPTEKNSGPDCVTTAGVNGFDISVARVFLNEGREVKRQDFRTHYIPEPKVECASANKPLS